jgi:hypothetical protein
MENKNYYPLRVDKKLGSAIVSSTDPERATYLQKDKEWEIENYDGHIIAESIPSKELAQQLVDAYNEKYGPVTPPVSQFKLPTNPDHIMKDGPQFDHLSDELKEKFVDELDMPDAMQSAFYIKGIKGGGEVEHLNTDMGLFFHQVDVVKVIEDLVSALRGMAKTTGNERETSLSKYVSSIQNAEAALGMLSGVKPKAPQEDHSHPSYLIHHARREGIVAEVAKSLPFDPIKNFKISNEMMYMIEQYLEFLHKDKP